NLPNNLNTMLGALLWLLYLLNTNFYSRYVIFTAYDQTSSIDYKLQPYIRRNFPILSSHKMMNGQKMFRVAIALLAFYLPV
uniref:Uncharacterized protein n=1 Tax=Echinococcus canadensis TaxID=519352 RepID=A0A915EWB4_9CEST